MTVRPLLEVSPIPPSTFESPELTPALRALVTALVDARVEERVRALVRDAPQPVRGDGASHREW